MRGILSPAAVPLPPGRTPRARAGAARKQARSHVRNKRTTAASPPGRQFPLLPLPRCPFPQPFFRRSRLRWLPQPRHRPRPYRRRPSLCRPAFRPPPQQRFPQQLFRCPRCPRRERWPRARLLPPPPNRQQPVLLPGRPCRRRRPARGRAALPLTNMARDCRGQASLLQTCPARSSQALRGKRPRRRRQQARTPRPARRALPGHAKQRSPSKPGNQAGAPLRPGRR